MKSLFKVCLQSGSIAALLGSGLMIAYYYMGNHPFIIPVYFDFRIFLFGVFIYFALKEFRDLIQDGILFFWQGIFGSLFFLLSFSVISSVLLGLFAYFVPEFVNEYVGLKTAELKSFPSDIIEKVGKDVYERNLQLLPSTNAFDLALIYFWQNFMIGFFVSIILSVVLRRLPKPE